jgi:hypothetical protein
MTTIFKNEQQTTKIEKPNYEPLPLVSPQGETLRQATGPRNPFKLDIGKHTKESGRE